MDGRWRLKISASSSTDQIYVKHLGFPGGTTDVELILETLSDYHLSSPGRLDDIFKVGGGDRWKNKHLSSNDQIDVKRLGFPGGRPMKNSFLKIFQITMWVVGQLFNLKEAATGDVDDEARELAERDPATPGPHPY